MAVLPGRHECSSSTCATAAIPGAQGSWCTPPPPCPAAARPLRRGCTGQRPRGSETDLCDEGGGSAASSHGTMTATGCKRPLDDYYHF
eukprot:6979324-Alexandrium_andersonii.AAC.1